MLYIGISNFRQVVPKLPIIYHTRLSSSLHLSKNIFNNFGDELSKVSRDRNGVQIYWQFILKQVLRKLLKGGK